MQTPFDGVSMRYSLDDAKAPTAQAAPSSTRCSGRGRSGTTAGRPSRTTRRSPAGATSTTTSGSSTTPRSIAPSSTTSRRRTGTRCASSRTSGSPRPARTVPSRSTTGRRSRSCSRRARCCRRRATATSTFRTRPRCPSRRPSISATARSPSAHSSISRPRGAAGVIFAHGSLFGGHALYVKENRLHYVYNFVGMAKQHVVATEDLPTGDKLILSASFDKDGEDPPGVATGTLSLWHGDTKVGEGEDQDAARQVHDRRRGPVRRPRRRLRRDRRLSRCRSRGAFTGGTIRRVAVDVSGEPYLDLEREAAAMLMRE